MCCTWSVSVFTEDEDIVEERDSTNTQDWAQGGVHGAVERGRSAGDAELHDAELPVARVGLKSGLVFLAFCHSDLVETGAQVKLGKPLGAGELIEQFIDEWHWVLTDHGHGIEASVVDAQAPCAIFLFNKEGW